MLFVAATPIGNLGDHSPRLVQALADAHLIVAEDTRTTKKLMAALGVTSSADFLPLHEHNERDVLERVLARAAGETVVLVSDAGMPGISDPGFALVREAHRHGIAVSPLPGPSAVIAALSASGLPTDRFSFEGFVPKKGKKNFFQELAHETRTMVFFESPHRLTDTLAQMVEVFGEDRIASVCRELTKMYEEVRTLTLAQLLEHFGAEVKGEITLVLSGNQGPVISLEQAINEARQRVSQGEKATDVARDLARETGYSKRELYDALLGQGA